MRLAKTVCHLFFHNMNGRRDNMAGVVMTQLENVLAQIRFQHLNTLCFQMIIEGNFLGDH